MSFRLMGQMMNRQGYLWNKKQVCVMKKFFFGYLFMVTFSPASLTGLNRRKNLTHRTTHRIKNLQKDRKFLAETKFFIKTANKCKKVYSRRLNVSLNKKLYSKI